MIKCSYFNVGSFLQKKFKIKMPDIHFCISGQSDGADRQARTADHIHINVICITFCDVLQCVENGLFMRFQGIYTLFSRLKLFIYRLKIKIKILLY